MRLFLLILIIVLSFFGCRKGKRRRRNKIKENIVFVKTKDKKVENININKDFRKRKRLWGKRKHYSSSFDTVPKKNLKNEELTQNYIPALIPKKELPDLHESKPRKKSETTNNPEKIPVKEYNIRKCKDEQCANKGEFKIIN
jgi:hypothetical protein